METGQESGWGAKEWCLTKPSPLYVQVSPTGSKWYLQASSALPFFPQSLGVLREKKWSYKTLAHTSAPSSSTPVSITVTYLSSIWTRRTVLSMWDLVPGSLLQGTHRWITWPSMPSWGLQSFQLFLPAFNRIPSSGHCSSFLFDRLIPSRIWLGSTIYIANRYGSFPTHFPLDNEILYIPKNTSFMVLFVSQILHCL